MPLILSLLCAMLLAALGSALAMATIAETRISAAYRRSAEMLHAAEGAGELAMQALANMPDWSRVLDGTSASTLVDGPASGSRVLPGGGVIDLDVATSVLRCGKLITCGDMDMDAVTAERPWGADNPRWTLFVYGRLDALLAGAPLPSPAYVVVWVGDDPAERDNQPLLDGGANIDGSVNQGRDVVLLLAHAYGAAGSRRAVEMTVARYPGGLQLVAWREVRQ